MDTTTSRIPSAFTVERTRADGAGIRLALTGELDLASVARFDREMSDAEALQPPSVTIDLRRLRFMDSSGLHALLGARRRALEATRNLILVPGPPAVQRVFTLTGTDAVFTFTERAD